MKKSKNLGLIIVIFLLSLTVAIIVNDQLEEEKTLIERTIQDFVHALETKDIRGLYKISAGGFIFALDSLHENDSDPLTIRPIEVTYTIGKKAGSGVYPVKVEIFAEILLDNAIEGNILIKSTVSMIKQEGQMRITHYQLESQERR